ncbi:endopeptidase [Achromobacter mucicolens]|uniref:endopeptidase n=1 Tax=Achromobacter mucicolens TaxID=1389922 RepID=UPI0009BEE7BF|nr:endopeptidase [Achromobacter mucicolens]
MMSKTLIIASVLAVALSACNKKEDAPAPATSPTPGATTPAPGGTPPASPAPTPGTTPGSGSTTPGGSTTPAS